MFHNLKKQKKNPLMTGLHNLCISCVQKFNDAGYEVTRTKATKTACCDLCGKRETFMEQYEVSKK